MKKIILAAATAAVLSTTALSSVFAEQDQFYVKGNLGWSRLDDHKTDIHAVGSKWHTKIKTKAKDTVFLELGAGYYLADNARFDLTLDHLFSPSYKGTKSLAGGFTESLKVKSNIDALLVNGYIDLFDMSITTVYLGAGVGISNVKNKYTYINTNPSIPNLQPAKAKAKTNFSYAFHLGVSTEFAPGMKGELGYSYRDYGKPKKQTVKDQANNSYSVGVKAANGHHVGAGIRFDI